MQKTAMMIPCILLAAGALAQQPTRDDNHFQPPMEDQMELFSSQFLEALKSGLKLSEKQAARIHSILQADEPAVQKKKEELRVIFEKMKPLHEELKTLMRDVRERVRSELEGEQKDKFDEMMMQLRMRHHPIMPMMGPQGMPPRDPRDFPPEMWHGGPGKPAEGNPPQSPGDKTESKP